MTSTVPTPTSDFVTQEYSTVRAPRDREQLYRDTYRGFGWQVVSVTTPIGQPRSVDLSLTRDRRVRNRPMVLELQRTAEAGLLGIAKAEHSVDAVPLAVAVGVGIAGSALLAASVFLLDGPSTVLSIVLGVLGLLGWALGLPLHRVARARRARRLRPIIDQRYDEVHAAAETAHALIS
ncbi:hypothetical protein HRK28_09000 [Rathayibacter sp. VKM Ac-2835]|uniref:hypothetical protein n=1 Tax=Rathayibacter sp. VKM Ac-2835 TaxID=2739043 RepID=UPI001565A0CE|nr:hypothetical protein [Rathayibacter sp. VKM Ac-2835]NRG41060.1 hypothetical protein [Rathayibacter sp. VKM Ac-2835]